MDVNALSLESRQRLAQVLQEKAYRARRNRLAYYKPYPKQADFHEAGATFKERLFAAANQCLSPWTFVETAGTTGLSGAVFFEPGARVVGWDGGSQCAARVRRGFLKGIEPAFRLVLDTGEFFDCSANHRVLTERGYLPIDQLVSLSSGRRCWHRVEDFQASCVGYGYLDDPRLPLDPDSGPGRLLGRVGVPTRSLIFSRSDAEERGRRYTSFEPESGRLTTVDGDAVPLADLFARFAGPATGKTVLRLTDAHRALRRLLVEESLGARSDREPLLLERAGSSQEPCRRGFFDAAETTERRGARPLGGGRSLDDLPLGSSTAALFRGDRQLAIFVPSETPELVGGAKIVALVPIGFQPIIDCEVPDANSYRAAGVIHHNSGKTLSGSAEMAMHLTGRYPDWWKGRVFETPISAWIASVTGEVTRDAAQRLLLGEPGVTSARGTGFIPADALMDTPPKQNIPKAVAMAVVKWGGGGDVQSKESVLTFKCFAPGMRVKMADGTLKAVETVLLGERVLCADGVARRVTQLHAYADAPRIMLTTRSGSIVVTPNHRMFTQRGEVDAGDLAIGDVLEVAAPDLPQTVEVEDWLVKMTALMIGDGCTRGKTPFFTCNEPPIVEEVKACLPDHLTVVPVAGTISYKISSSLHKFNALKDSLENDGLWGKKAHFKFIPPWVFRLPRRQKVLFLRWLWGCDGSLKSRDAVYTTSSKRLAGDVRLLLWDLGIHATYKKHVVKNQSGKSFDSYYLGLYGENRIKFEEVGKLNRSLECAFTPRPKGDCGQIVAIEPVDAGDAYCVTVEDAHELIVEGYRVGNSYDQGREKFQGGTVHVMAFDEEPPLDIYTEGKTRTNVHNGIVYLTFTPLMGMSDTVRRFLIDKEPGTHVTFMGIYDALHYTKEQADDIVRGYPEHEREARAYGRPVLGSGAVFPVAESELMVDPFEIPGHWHRIAGLDLGWDHPTAAAWLAHDTETDTIYVTDVYAERKQVPAIHASAIKSRGEWIPVAWPHDALQTQKDSGKPMRDTYRAEGLNMLPERAAFEDGSMGLEPAIMQMLNYMQKGKFKVFKHLEPWFAEYRTYHRKDGAIVTKYDDILSATRYAFVARRFARPFTAQVLSIYRGSWRA